MKTKHTMVLILALLTLLFPLNIVSEIFDEVFTSIHEGSLEMNPDDLTSSDFNMLELEIEAALSDYDNLSDEDKDLYKDEYDKLVDLKTSINVLTFLKENENPLDLTTTTVGIDNKTTVEAAVAEYNLLTTEAQAEVAPEKQLLDSLFAEILILEEAETFRTDNAGTLALTPSTVEIIDRSAVESAVAEYNLLTTEAQAKVLAEKQLLDSLLAEILILEETEQFRTDNTATLALTPATVEITDKAAVQSAIAEHDLLSTEAKAKVAPEKQLLDSLLAEIVILEEAETFRTDNAATLALTPATVTIADKAAVQSAVAEYDLLSTEAKAEVSAEKQLLDSLLAEIVILEEAEIFRTDNATTLSLTPATVAISDKAAVEAALAEYNLLSIDAQAEVAAEKLLLDELLVEILVLEEIEAFRTNNAVSLALTLETVEVSDKTAIEAALAEYELLSTDAQAEVAADKALLDSLLAEIVAFENSEYIDWEDFYEPALVTEEIILNGRTWFVNNVAIDCNPTYDVCVDTKALALKSGAYFESRDAFVNGIDKITLHHGALRYNKGARFAFKVEYELQSAQGTWLTLQENGSDLIIDVLTGDPLTYVEIDIYITEAVNIRFVPIISKTTQYINLDNIRVFEHVPTS